MSSYSYTIPKALQKDVHFFGLKAKYVDRAFKGIFLVLALGLFLGAFTSTIVGFVLSIIVVTGYLGLMLFYSNAYGENGYVKLKANSKTTRIHKGQGEQEKSCFMRHSHLSEAFPIFGYEAPFLISKERGCYCIPLEVVLPEIFTLTTKEYQNLNQLFSNIISILGENTLIHKQDLFFESFYPVDEKRLQRDWFEAEDELHFKERPFLKHRCFLGLHKVPKITTRKAP